MDVWIRGGMIVDGTGSSPSHADVLIEGDTIKAIGRFTGVEGCRVIDATDLIVSPGFIDGHTHAEISLMLNRQATEAVYQGVSSIVTAQCGLGFAPMRPEDFDASIRMNAGIFTDARRRIPRWQSFAEYLSLLDGCAVNAASLVPHNAVRQMALGFSDAPLTGDTLITAQDALDQALREGGVGLSVGLCYYPGAYSDTQELIELCRVVKRHGGLFCVHHRMPEGYTGINPHEEIVRVVRETGVRLNMLHYKTGGSEGVDAIIEPYQSLIQDGFEVTFEYYPYLVGAGMLLSMIPGWVQVGGFDSIMARLSDASLQDRLLADIAHRYSFFFPDGMDIRISLTKDLHSPDLGRTLAEIAAERDETVPQALVRLLRENELELAFVGVEWQDETLQQKLYDDQYALLRSARYTIGSDAIPEGVLPHPRAFGTFPRVLRMMRERGMPVQAILPKFTSIPAKLYKLRDRGVLAVGKKADICVFDFEHITDTATYEQPRRAAEDVHALLVNGLPVLDDGALTGILPGRALRARK